jgi:hypothetical protein
MVQPTHVLAESHSTSCSSLRHRRSFSEGVAAAARCCGRCAGGEGALLAEGVVALLVALLVAGVVSVGVVSVAALSLIAARACALAVACVGWGWD